MSVFERLKQGHTSSGGGVFSRLKQEKQEKMNEMSVDHFKRITQTHDQQMDSISQRQEQKQQQIKAADQQFINNLPMNRMQQPEKPKLLTDQLRDINSELAKNRPKSSKELLEESRQKLRSGEIDIQDVIKKPDETLGGNLKKLGDSFQRFDAGFQDALSFGLTTAMDRRLADSFDDPNIKAYYDKRLEGLDSPEANVGGFLGTTLGGAGAYGLIGNLGKSIAKPLLRTGVRGTAAGAVYGTAGEVADLAMDTRQDGANTAGERLANIGLEAALGGALDVGIDSAGKVISDAVKGLRKGNNIEDHINTRPLSKTAQKQPSSVQNDTVPTRESISTSPETINAQNTREVVESMIAQAEVDPNNPLVRDNNFSGIGIIANAPKPRLYDNLKTDTKSQLVTKTRKPETTVGAKIRQSYINTVDDLFSFQNFDKNVEKILGRKLKASEGTYIPAITSRGSDIITKQILTENMVNAQGSVIAGSKSLKEILRNIPKGKQVDFEDYLVNKHAMTRYLRDEKVYRDDLNWTPELGAKKVAEYEKKYPQFKQMAEDYYQFRYNLAKSWLVDTGFITEDTLKKWMDENPFYVPMQRQFTDLEKRGQGLRAKSGFGDQSAPVRGYSKTGSQRQIISPIETTIENVDAMVKASKRNQVLQNLVRILRRDPEALEGWAELVTEQSAVRHTSIKKINDILKEDGIDGLVNQFNNDYEILFNKSIQKGIDKDNVVRVMMNGNPVYVRINDPQLLDAISGLTPQAQGIMMESISNITRVVKLLTTGANPVFSVTRNMFRDIPMAFIASKTTNNPLRFGYDLIEGFVSALSNGKLYQSFKNVGGGHASAVAADRNLLAQSKREIIGNRTPRDYPGYLLGQIENFNNALEAAPRLGEFKRMVKQADSYENRLKGLFEANDITVNFKRRGKVSPQLDPFILYWNASVQGLDKAIRIFKDNPVQATVKAFASITVPTIVLYALNHDKQEYKETSDYIKDNFMLIPTGNEKNPFVRIPKPQVVGVPFSTLPERIMRQWKDEDPEAFREFATTVINQFLPAGVSGIVQDTVVEGRLPDPTADTIFGPFSDIRANRNFAGAAIVPGYLEGVSPRLQYDSRTSEISKWIGDKLNLSPKQIDHLIKSYTGVLGQLGIPATSEGATVGDTLLRQVTVDPVYSNNLMSKFYDTKDKLDTMYKDIQQTGEIPQGYNDEVRKFMNRVSSAMSDVRKQMRAVEQDKSLTSQQKKETNRELQKILNNLAREANKIAEQAVR